jgi:hypothetical protein
METFDRDFFATIFVAIVLFTEVNFALSLLIDVKMCARIFFVRWSLNNFLLWMIHVPKV